MNSEHRPRLPDPTTRMGAVFYAVLGALIAAALLAVWHHVHIHIIWSR